MELTVIGSQLAKNTFHLAVDLLAANDLGFGRIIAHQMPLEEANKAFELLRAGEAVKAQLLPWGGRLKRERSQLGSLHDLRSAGRRHRRRR